MENQQGVIIPTETIERSKTIKKNRRTLRQLPIYRDASNLKYTIVCLYKSTPRNLTKFIDGTLSSATEVKRCIGLAEATRDPMARSEYLTMARVLSEDIQDDMAILHRLNLISNDTEKKMKSLTRSLVAQCVSWRDYVNSLGVHEEQKMQ